MSKHSNLLLKIACCALGVILLVQLSSVLWRLRPIDRLSIPELPHLTVSLDAAVLGKNTNLTLGATVAKGSTNSSSVPAPVTAATNPASGDFAKGVSTNPIRAEIPLQSGTNPLADQTSKVSGTNAVPTQASIQGLETDAVTTLTSERKATNRVADRGAVKTGTNLNARSLPVPTGATKLAEIPPLIQARIDRVYQSEILGTVMRPLPMGLLGIAGNVAFLRTANGQTGMVKEGDELGGIKLLRIGVNRVLIEHEGQTRELTIFSGFGSETLLQKTKESSNEILTKPR